MMRTDSIPLTLAMVVVTAGTTAFGFDEAFPWGVGTYIVGLVGLIAYVLPKPVYDHSEPAGGVWPLVGWVDFAAMAYLWVRWTFWYPGELWFLQDVSWLGAAFMLLLPMIADGVLQAVMWALLRSGEPRRVKYE